jgi:hypothetical protein
VTAYNVLFDKFDAEKIHSSLRFPLVSRVLEESHADVLLLSEVTGTFLRRLLGQEWVQRQYYASDSLNGVTVKEYGQLILSKRPFSTQVAYFSRMKMCVVGSCRDTAQHLQLAAVHLPSNYFDKHSKDGLHGVGVDVQGKTEDLPS